MDKECCIDGEPVCICKQDSHQLSRAPRKTENRKSNKSKQGLQGYDRSAEREKRERGRVSERGEKGETLCVFTTVLHKQAHEKCLASPALRMPKRFVERSLSKKE